MKKKLTYLALSCLLIFSVIYWTPIINRNGKYVSKTDPELFIKVTDSKVINPSGEYSYEVNYLERIIYFNHPEAKVKWPIKVVWGGVKEPNLKDGWINYKKDEHNE